MSMQKYDNFNERRAAAAKAQEAARAKFKARPGPDDPAILARQAEQKAIAEAREVRIAARKVEKAAEAERKAQEALALAAQKERERLEQDVLAQEAAARKVALAAEQKAARDARYAARNSRRK